MKNNLPQFREDAFWTAMPMWKDVDYKTFIDHRWQEKNAITSHKKLLTSIQSLVSPQFLEDAQKGFLKAPMAVRISPYLLSLMNWENPYHCPLRKQFLPLASQLQADHPMLRFDSLHEQEDAPLKGLTHRYPDKVLFLALDTCPVYCRFCTRAYAVGSNTAAAEKISIKATKERWAQTFTYLAEHSEVEDVVISGGDAFRLKDTQIDDIASELLKLDHIRRFRFATKGPAVMPMKILTDEKWIDAISFWNARAKQQHKELSIHTHVNHPAEIAKITQRAMNLLFIRGIKIRNQSVFQKGVNDSSSVMYPLIKTLSYMNVQPYYVYVHDLTQGTEDMRTSVKSAMTVEKEVRGTTAGFNTPTFVVDAPGGGGKRGVHSCEWYDTRTGISVWRSPSVKPDQQFLYFDPLHSLEKKYQTLWQNPTEQKAMIECALGHSQY